MTARPSRYLPHTYYPDVSRPDHVEISSSRSSDVSAATFFGGLRARALEEPVLYEGRIAITIHGLKTNEAHDWAQGMRETMQILGLRNPLAIDVPTGEPQHGDTP